MIDISSARTRLGQGAASQAERRQGYRAHRSIVALDQQRRALLTEVEAIKASRNQLNKQMGRFRSDKGLSPARMVAGARQAVAALRSGDIEGFLQALNPPDDPPWRAPPRPT